MAHRLSKSRYQTGLQCPKALWLGCHAPQLADPIDESQQHIFDTGNAVGEFARERFAGGVLVAEDYLHAAEALETTARLLQDPPPALFEAAFRHGNVLVRADIIVKVADDLWDLYEVKSSNSLKPENITDVAVQMWVLEGAGLRVRRAYLMHLDRTYEWAGGDYDLDRLFVAEDVTDVARTAMTDVPTNLDAMFAMLEGELPEIEVGPQCDKPHTCAFWGHCHASLPARPVTDLPRITPTTLASLFADGIRSIDDVPLDYPGLTSAQRNICRIIQDGTISTGDASGELSTLSFPIHFVDFETFMCALPPFPGTHSWQMIPFQWSDHVMTADGGLEHHEHLHEGPGDPRPGFVTSLLDVLGTEGSIVVYSPFESTRLRELSEAFPELAGRITVVQSRIFDLLAVVRKHVRHPECALSSSIKSVLPAFVPDLSYAELEIGEGGTASLRYLQASTGALSDEEAEQVYAALREYCGLDTLAMVKLYGALR